MRILKLVLLLGSLALVGAGCLGTSKTSGGSDGGIYKTADAGGIWAQQTMILSSKGVGSIGNANVIALEADPRDHLAMYAGTVSNGLLYSLDGTASWQQPRDAGMREGAVSAVEVDPTNSCIVFVAKGQRLYKTVDCMRTFSSEAYVETRSGVTVTEIAVDWYNPKIVWMGLSNGDVMKSEDGSATWVSSVSTKESVTGILVSNADSRMVLVATEKGGFYKTMDAGITWTQVKDELKEFKNAAKVTALAQDKTGGTVLAATAYGLIRSKDFGSTWEALQLLSSPNQVAIGAIALNPTDTNEIVYAAGNTYYHSVDGGLKWTTSEIPTTRLPTSLIMDATDAGAAYLGVASLEK
jgi:photosystem II stability/assembly factor-like uncharacterized protein